MNNDEIVLPEDGEAAELAMKKALYIKATGHYEEDVTIITGGKLGDQEIRKRRFVPGDVKAMNEYIRKYGAGI